MTSRQVMKIDLDIENHVNGKTSGLIEENMLTTGFPDFRKAEKKEGWNILSENLKKKDF